MAIKEEEISRLEVLKKKKKKLSCDERNRVIRFTTGEPYLEYLPNMLSKDKVLFVLFRRRSRRPSARRNSSSIAEWPTAPRSRRRRRSTSRTMRTSCHRLGSIKSDILICFFIGNPEEEHDCAADVDQQVLERGGRHSRIDEAS